MNRAPAALRSGTTPTSDRGPFEHAARPRTVGPGRERLDVVGDLGPDQVGAGIELLLEAGRIVGVGERHLGDPDQVARRRRPARPRWPSRPRSRMPTHGRRSRRAPSMSSTVTASGSSPTCIGSPDRQSTLRAPSAHAPSRSAVIAEPVAIATRELQGRLDARAGDERAPGDGRHVRGRGRVVGDVRRVDRADERAGVGGDRVAVGAARRHDLAGDRERSRPQDRRRAARRLAPARRAHRRTPAAPRPGRCSRAASRPSSARPRRARG